MISFAYFRKISIPPQRVTIKSEGQGTSRADTFKGKCEANLIKSPEGFHQGVEGGYSTPQKTSVEGVGGMTSDI